MCIVTIEGDKHVEVTDKIRDVAWFTEGEADIMSVLSKERMSCRNLGSQDCEKLILEAPLGRKRQACLEMTFCGCLQS